MNESTQHVRRGARTAVMAGVLAVLAGCQHRVTIDPIHVEPIHLTLDVTLKVDRELDRFFDFEDPAAPPADQAVPEEAPPADADREGDPS